MAMVARYLNREATRREARTTMSETKLLAADRKTADFVTAALGVLSQYDGWAECVGGWLVVTLPWKVFTLADARVYDPKYGSWRLDLLPIIPTEWQWQPRNAACATVADLLRRLVAERAPTLVACADTDETNGITALRQAGWAAGIHCLQVQMDVMAALDALLPPEATAAQYAAEVLKQQCDWLVGVNLSRALTSALGRGADERQKFIVGRAQTAALAVVWANENACQPGFRSEVTYRLAATVTAGGQNIELRSAKQFSKEEAAALAQEAQGQSGALRVTSADTVVAPPLLPDLATLQGATASWGWPESKTADIAWRLCELNLITSPQTTRRHLPTAAQADAAAILETLAGGAGIPPIFRQRHYDDRLARYRQAIVPVVGELDGLTQDERRLLTLIGQHFVAAHLPDAVERTTAISLEVGGVLFESKATVAVTQGWRAAFSSEADADDDEPLVVADGMATVLRVRVEERRTTPPKPYTEASLIADLADVRRVASIQPETLAKLGDRTGLGSPSSLVDSLLKREYLTAAETTRRLSLTDKGRRLMDELHRIELTSLTDIGLAIGWERILDGVATGKVAAADVLTGAERSVMAAVEKIKAATFTAFRGGEGGKALPPLTDAERQARWKAKLAAGLVLAVPFDRREEAKALGAKYDGERRCWIALPGADLEPFRKAGML